MPQNSMMAQNLGGNCAVKRFTIGEAELTAAALVQTIALFTLPRGSVIFGYRIKPTTAFAGASITALGVTVGSSSLGVSGVAPSFDLLQAVGAGIKAVGGLFKDGPDADETINAYFTAVGANLSVMSAGSFYIDIYYWPMTTPQS